MGPRLRKLIGGLGILVFLGLYVVAAVSLVDLLPDWGWLKGLYFVIVGLAWGLPLIPLLTWMDRGKWR
jgi:hypothetical protein